MGLILIIGGLYLTAVESDDSLSEHNVVHKIKEEIEKRDRHTYEEWQRNDFDIDYKFGISIATSTFVSVVGLLSMAVTNRNSKILRILLDKGANIHTIIPLFVSSREDREGIMKFLALHEVELQPYGAATLSFFPTNANGDFVYLTKKPEYWNRCLDEIKRVDVLINGLAYGALKRTLGKGDYKSEFPIYADDLGRRFEIAGDQRVDALKVGEVIIGKIFAKRTGKEGPFNLKIAEYLSNEDIKSLRKAVVQIMDGYNESYGEGAVASNLIHQEEGSQSDSRLNDVGAGNFNRPEKIRKSLEIGIACGVIAALIVGTGCGVAGIELSILAIIGIAVAVGFVADSITYLVLKPSDELDKPDLEVASQQVPEKAC